MSDKLQFTDDDLKEYLRRHGDVPFYVALLARLEAADLALQWADSLCTKIVLGTFTGEKDSTYLRLRRELEDARKAAGK